MIKDYVKVTMQNGKSVQIHKTLKISVKIKRKNLFLLIYKDDKFITKLFLGNFKSVIKEKDKLIDAFNNVKDYVATIKDDN